MKPTTEPTSRGKVRSSSPELRRYIFSTFFTSWRKHTNRKVEYVQVANTADGDTGRLKSLRKRWPRVVQKLTDDVLVVLRDELFPLAWIRRSEVDVDEAITWSVQVGLERELRVLVGDIFVLSIKIVDELHPWQKS